MAYTINSVEVWTGSVEDRPGGLAEKLENLAGSGASLEFVLARRDAPGKGVLFVAPLKGAKQIKAAKEAGLAKSDSLTALRLEGGDASGVGAKITRAMAEAKINVRGLSAATIGRRAVVYVAFDGKKDAAKARGVLKRSLKIK